MFSVNRRIKEVRASKGYTQKDFAEQFGLKWSQIKDIETEKTKPSVDLVSQISEKLAIDSWWLLTGKGSMHSSPSLRGEAIHTDTGQNTLSIPLVSHTAQAGRGNDISAMKYEVIETMAISKSFFKTPPAGTVRVIKVDGYSMVPMLYPDTYILFDECGEFKTDGLYIINYDNELMVKLIQIDPRGTLYIKSVNPDYQSWTIDPKDQTVFRIIGRVLRLIV